MKATKGVSRKESMEVFLKGVKKIEDSHRVFMSLDSSFKI